MEVRTKCHPQAVGRVSDQGTEEYTASFALESGTQLTVRMGRAGWESLRRGILSQDVNEAVHQASVDLIR